MKIRATVQRSGKGDGPFPVAEYLTGAPLAWQWTRTRADAFEFPDYLPPGDCHAGEGCQEHADCVARALRAWPVVIGDRATEPRPAPPVAPAPSEPVEPITQRIRDARARKTKAEQNRRPIPPEEVYARMERRHEA